jgi:transcriptional regulator with XRE-family HTH domain
MENFNKSADAGMDIVFSFIKERMKARNMPQYKLAKIVGVSEGTLIRNFSKETEMSLRTYLKICGALELNPYLIPKEMDKTDFIRMYFN